MSAKAIINHYEAATYAVEKFACSNTVRAVRHLHLCKHIGRTYESPEARLTLTTGIPSLSKPVLAQEFCPASKATFSFSVSDLMVESTSICPSKAVEAIFVEFLVFELLDANKPNTTLGERPQV